MKRNPKKDLRVLKTKQSIKEAFIDLVELKGFNKVSVTNIVQSAQINRNTFYLHYDNKEDLVKQLIIEASSKMNEALGTFVFLSSYSFDEIQEIQIRWGVRNLLMFIKPEIEFYRIILLDDSLRGYINELFDMIKNHLSDLLHVKNPRSNLIFEYTYNGMLGLIQQWIIYSPTTEAETAKILAKLAYINLQQFKEINLNH